MNRFRIQFLAVCLALVVKTAPAQVNVLTWHNDLARTGQNLKETVLTPASVNPDMFGKMFTLPVDGYVFAQPLYMEGLDIPGKGKRNVVFIATEHDSVFAFDADSAASPLWKTSFIDPAHGVNPVPQADVLSVVIPIEIGITGTPVIDAQAGTLYVVAVTKEISGGTTRYVQRLHALDVTTGAERAGSPVEITASVPGIGRGGDGLGNVVFNPLFQRQRAGLVLYNGVVYIGWAAHFDQPDMHGWVLGYNATTLQRTTVFCTSPDANLGTIWQAGGAPAVDPAGFIYFETGNGPFDVDQGGRDFGDSFLKLSTSGGGLAVMDYFTPYNQVYLNMHDIDLGAGGVVILPDAVGSAAHPHLLIGAGKDGTIYLLDRDAMGHFNAAGDTQIVQSLPYTLGPVRSLAAYFDGMVYLATYTDHMKAFRIANGALSSAPVQQSTHTFEYPGSTPSISANGDASDPGATAVVWVVDPGSTAGLLAYAARDLSKPLYDSRSLQRGDDPGPYVRFSVPTVANGKVFVGTRNGLAVYGPGLWAPVPDIAPPSGSYSQPVTVTITDRLPGAEIHFTTDGSIPSRSTPLYTGSFTVDKCTRVRAIAYISGGKDSGIGESLIEVYGALGGDGLMGSYYPNTSFAGAPTTRVDPTVDFHWKDIDPIPGIPAINFSVRWTGAIEPACSDTYTFYVNSDDGAKLWIDGRQVVSDWTSHNERETSGTIYLTAGRRYSIRMDFYQQTFFAVAQLSWSLAGKAKEIVPQERLFSAPVPVSVVIAPAAVAGGQNAVGTITLSHPAPGGGLTVALTSAQPSEAGVPPNVTFSAGAISATFPVTTVPVKTDRSELITATSGRVEASGTLTLKAPALSGIAVSPVSLIGGTGATGKITLTGVVAAGAGTLNVAISTTGPASAPATVAVPEGAASASFSVTTSPVTADAPATITATLGTINKSKTISVKAPVLKSLTLTPSKVTGGKQATGTVTLTGPAAADFVVTLSASRVEASVPASVTVPAGATSATFQIQTTNVTAITSVTITASAGGLTRSATLKVTP